MSSIRPSEHGPIRPPSRSRSLGSLLHTIAHYYDATQVESRGSYSVERMHELDRFAASQSLASCALAMLATPLPCVMAAILIDAVPLNPSSLGLAHSHWFWWRVAVLVACITFTLLEQLRVFVPRLQACSTRALLAMSVVIGIGCAAYGVLMAYLVGYPLPFTLLFGSPSWQVLFWACVAVQWGRQLSADRTLRREVVAFYKVVLVQLSLTAVYPAYNHVFSRLDGWQQTVCALGLSALKVLAKNAFRWVFQLAEDFLPEVVIFNVEIFHALFVAACMQSSTSVSTTVVVIMADLVQIWAHMHEVDKILNTLRRLESKTQRGKQPVGVDDPSSTTLPPPLTTALLYVAIDRSLHSNPHIRLPTMPDIPATSSPLSENPSPATAIHPIAPGATPDPSPQMPLLIKLRRFTESFAPRELEHLERQLSQAERYEYVSTVLRVLHFTEFLVLIEFVEVAVPLVYCLYLIAIAHMPNRMFYAQFAEPNGAGRSLLGTVGRIAAYTTLELATFVLLCLVLQRKLQLSPVKHLAFVLRRQWQLVQSKMILWVIVLLGLSLEQFGYDYTFKFAWLKTPRGS